MLRPKDTKPSFHNYQARSKQKSNGYTVDCVQKEVYRKQGMAQWGTRSLFRLNEACIDYDICYVEVMCSKRGKSVALAALIYTNS